MTVNTIPKILYQNKISEILDEMRESYGKLSGNGYVYGLIAIDQDAKIIAIDSRFDRTLNYWDLSSIGAALYGVSKQGQDFFEADYLERASIIYNNLQIFVRSIGKVSINKKGKREILIVLLAEKGANIGVIIMQMNRFGLEIKKTIESSGLIKNTLKMTEKELKEHIKKLKKEIFRDKISTMS
jgi:predicted regulator of Ras-like GTPase activity (Roadblock/LC7/MglB family)